MKVQCVCVLDDESKKTNYFFFTDRNVIDILTLRGVRIFKCKKLKSHTHYYISVGGRTKNIYQNGSRTRKTSHYSV